MGTDVGSFLFFFLFPALFFSFYRFVTVAVGSVAVSPYLNGSSSLNVATTPDARRTPLPTFA